MPNHNQQPTAARRRKLKQHILDRDGDGTTVKCACGCERMLTIETMTLDRNPLRGIDGGTYRKNNVRGMCLSGNSRDGQRVSTERRRMAKAAAA